ncbi:stage II sporulation protein E [Acetohalobium arabaticum]|uniref:Protein serine/threonine phosphatase n=1 Tax=Acetohalobium arabaticum (strain ATCC 49924 / DSM 5501 / Z-7288) TaxID=574087 RepID=D9QSX1_ACEAZ|nr:stage II sporulation protein E [Acetohalobium arabaticum]ADL11659.1 protein serine/threonine phosphatase [Acetohalobium arabaticum DSM 5501]
MFAKTDLSTYKRLEKKQQAKSGKVKGLIKNLFLELDMLHLVYFFIGLVLSRAVLSPKLLPFGLTFFGVVLYRKIYSNEKTGRVILFFCSTYMGYYTVLGLSWALGKYLIAGCLFTLIAGFLGYKDKVLTKWQFALLNGGSILVIEVLNLVFFPQPLYNSLIRLLGPILIGVLNLVLLEGLVPLFSSKENFEEINALALLVTLAAFNVGLPNINVGIVNLPRIFSSLIIMLIAINSGGAIAAVVGMVIGLFYGISNSYTVEVTGLYALAGLVSGHFKKEDKLGVIVGFILSVLLYTIFLVEVGNINAIVSEALLAGGIIAIIPKAIINLFEPWIPGTEIHFTETEQQKSTKKQEVISRVQEMSGVFTELANAFEEKAVAEASEDDNLEELLSMLTNQVCSNCEYYNICWDQEFFKTYQRTVDALSVAEEEGRIKSKKLDSIMGGDCNRSVRFSDKINRFLEKYETDTFWQQKIEDSREIIGNQLSGISQILEKMGSDLEMEVKFNNNLQRAIRSELQSHGIFLNQIDITKDRHTTKMAVTKQSCNGDQECTKQIIPILNQMLDQNFKIEWSECGASLGEDLCSFEIASAARYWVETGIAQVSPDGEEVSGDNYEIIEVDDKETVSVLSDGMGTGKRAALESNTTVQLVGKLINAGFDKKLAIKTVNSALLLRSSEEIFATLDISAINRYTGEADFIKIGSVPTFVKRSNRNIELVRSSSLPVGIIDNIDIELTQKLQLLPGDMVVMVTDGILDLQDNGTKQEEWMLRILRNNLIDDPQSLAEYILQQAVNLKNRVDDDMTVVVTRLKGYQNK